MLPRPFSILNRIDIPATYSVRIQNRRAKPLSVSSTGSISLQQLVTDPPGLRNGNFQYPQPDRYPCNVAMNTRFIFLAVAFSILNRIDIPATQYTRRGLAHGLYTFSILNRIDIPATASFVAVEELSSSLSVSSTGSISLQLLTQRGSIRRILSFSILNRIDIPATWQTEELFK